MAPWRWMNDDQVFGVKDPRTGMTGWCVVLGALEQVYGISVYLGDRGYSHLSEAMAGGIRPFSDLAVEMDALFLHFIEREEVPSDDWPALKVGGMGEGIRIGGRIVWPWVRRVEPWRFPRTLTGGECEQLSEALDQACCVAERLQADPKMPLHRRSGTLLVRIYEQGEDGRSWYDAWESPRMYTSPEVWAKPDIQRLDEILKRSTRTDDTWDTDTFPLPAPVREGEVLYYPRVVLVVDKASGRALHWKIVKPDERDWTPVIDVVLEAMETLGQVPSLVRVRNRDLYELLDPLRATLDVRVCRVDSMAQMDSVADGLSEWLKRS